MFATSHETDEIITQIFEALSRWKGALATSDKRADELLYEEKERLQKTIVRGTRKRFIKRP